MSISESPLYPNAHTKYYSQNGISLFIQFILNLTNGFDKFWKYKQSADHVDKEAHRAQW